MTASMGYLRFVDGLRALAVVSVVLYHANPAWLPGGFLGVDLFFVLSGFLITGLILQALQTGGQGFSFWQFYVRRARRLLPASLVVLVASLVLAFVLLEPRALIDFGHSLRASALFHANLHFHVTSGYFDAPAHTKPLLHFWSLAVEEQFYFIWPLLLVLMWRFSPPSRRLWGVATLLAVLIVVSLVFAEWGARQVENQSFYLLQGRAWQLGVGAFSAVLLLMWRDKAMPIWLREAVTAAGLLAIISSFIWLSDQSVLPGFLSLPLVLGTASILVVNADKPGWVAAGLSWRPLVFLGLISYSLYLWHWPLFTFARIVWGATLSWWLACVLIAVSLLCAIISWRYVEQPFRQRRVLAKDWQAMTAGLVGLGVLASLGLGLVVSRGLPQRISGLEGRFYHQMAQGNPLRSRCDGFEKLARSIPDCLLGSGDKAKGPTLIVMGDSLAEQWSPALARYADQNGLVLRQATQSACAAIIGYSVSGRKPGQVKTCLNYQRALLAFVKDNPQISHVVLGGNWRGYPPAKLKRNALGEELGLPERPESLAHAITLSLKALSLTGEVAWHVVGVPPQHESFSADCIKPSTWNAAQCLPPMEAQDVQHKRQEDEDLRQLDGPFTSLLDMLCDDRGCRYIEDETMLYRDTYHLSYPGVMHLGEKMPWFSVTK